MSGEGLWSWGTIVSFLVLVICALAAVYVWSYEGSYRMYGYSIPLYPYRPYVSIFAIGAFIGLGGLLFSLAIGSKRQETLLVSNSFQNFQEVGGASQIICGNCGNLNDIDAVYCNNCRNQLR